MWSASFYPIWTMWALALLMEMGPHKDREKLWLGVICGLSLLVLYSAPRGFSPGTPVFPSPQKICNIWFELISLVSPISALVLNPLTLNKVVMIISKTVKAERLLRAIKIFNTETRKERLVSLLTVFFCFRPPYEQWKAAYATFFPPQVN